MSCNAQAWLRRCTIGYVFQDFNPRPGLTAAQNVWLPLELDGRSARKARVAAFKVLGRLGLSEHASSYPDQMSGGERQRVAIARAMVGEHRLLLADEPSGTLDSVNADAVMRLLQDACKNEGMATMVVTHDAQLASWAGPCGAPVRRPGERPDGPGSGSWIPARALGHGLAREAPLETLRALLRRAGQRRADVLLPTDSCPLRARCWEARHSPVR